MEVSNTFTATKSSINNHPKMKLKIEITMDNAAFDGAPFEGNAGAYVAGLLQKVADKCDYAGPDISDSWKLGIIDQNGSKVGFAEVTDEQSNPATAKLLASAPALLEALKVCQSAIFMAEGSENDAYRQAGAAIALADWRKP